MSFRKLYAEPKVTMLERADRPAQQFESQLDCTSVFDLLKLRQDATVQPALTRTASQLLSENEKPLVRRPPSGVNFALPAADADRLPLAPAAGSPLNRRGTRTADFALPIEASLLTTF